MTTLLHTLRRKIIKILYLDPEGLESAAVQHPEHKRYYFTESGEVVSLVNPDKPRILARQTSVDGYYRVKLDGQYHGLHRELAKIFIDNPLNLPQVNHINGRKTDNRLENLEWVTQQDNLYHCMDVLKNHNWGRRAVRATKDHYVWHFKSEAEAARELNLFQSNVNKVLSGLRTHTGGWSFEYIEEKDY